jgi:hypothetical protein
LAYIFILVKFSPPSVFSLNKIVFLIFAELTIIKSLIIPQLTYALTILPSPGELFLNDIEKIILIFFWDDKPAKIKKNYFI